MTKEKRVIRIYVACLASYNNGILHGRWIDATQGVDEIYTDIFSMLNSSTIQGAEEWAIHDHEGFEGLDISESENISHIVRLAWLVSLDGLLGAKLYEHYGSFDAVEDAMNDKYAGTYRSLVDFAQDITEERTQIPENLKAYIDYDRMARDMEINDVLVFETGFELVHVFWAQ